MSDFDPTTTASRLSTTLDALEASLEPLHARPFSETREVLEPLARAKMDVLLSYAVHDLTWVYLKIKGIDPDAHLVTPELERIKTYYSKIRRVEEPEQVRKTTVDVPAARRHITHALPSSRPRSSSSRPAMTSGLFPSDAAARAREQALDAVRDNTARRFRFVAETAEKVVPGQVGASHAARVGTGKGKERADESDREEDVDGDAGGDEEAESGDSGEEGVDDENSGGEVNEDGDHDVGMDDGLEVDDEEQDEEEENDDDDDDDDDDADPTSPSSAAGERGMEIE